MQRDTSTELVGGTILARGAVEDRPRDHMARREPVWRRLACRAAASMAERTAGVSWPPDASERGGRLGMAPAQDIDGDTVRFRVSNSLSLVYIPA